jgi:hypothetical protein
MARHVGGICDRACLGNRYRGQEGVLREVVDLVADCCPRNFVALGSSTLEVTCTEKSNWASATIVMAKVFEVI